MKKFPIISIVTLSLICSFLGGVYFTIKNIRPLGQTEQTTRIELFNHVFTYENY